MQRRYWNSKLLQWIDASMTRVWRRDYWRMRFWRRMTQVKTKLALRGNYILALSSVQTWTISPGGDGLIPCKTKVGMVNGGLRHLFFFRLQKKKKFNNGVGVLSWPSPAELTSNNNKQTKQKQKSKIENHSGAGIYIWNKGHSMARILEGLLSSNQLII